MSGLRLVTDGANDDPKLAGVIIDEAAVVRALRLLGLRQTSLLQIAEGAALARLNCPAQYPKIGPALTQWMEATYIWRVLHGPEGWTADRTDNQECIKNPDGTVTIMALGGDDGVGLAHRIPQTVTTRKNATAQKIFVNQVANIQLLLAIDGIESSSVRPLLDPTVWMHLIYVDEHLNEIRSELSMVETLSQSGAIQKWKCRIVLSVIPLDRGMQSGSNDVQPSSGAEIDQSPVTRRKQRNVQSEPAPYREDAAGAD